MSLPPASLRQPTASKPVQGRIVSLALFAVGALLLSLSFPRVLAGLATAPHGPILQELGKTLPPNAQSRARQAYVRAGGWLETPQIHATLGALALTDARRLAASGDALAARAQFEYSAAQSRAAVTLSPLQPYTWARLAQADLAGASTGSVAMEHLGMALSTARWDPGLVMARLGMAFAGWSDMTDDVRAGFLAQIRHAARLYPMALARLSRQWLAQEHVMQALEDSPDLLRRFSLAYSRI